MTMYLFKKSKAGLLALLLLIGLGSQAQQVKRLTIDEAVDLGMSYNKQLKVSQSKVAVSGMKYKQELGMLAPAISINSSITHNSTNIPVLGFPGGVFGPKPEIIAATLHDYYLNSLNISQVVFAGLRGWNTLKMTREQTMAANYDLAADRLNARNNIIVAYYNHYKLIQSKKVVDENIKVLQQRLKDVQNLQTVGMALKNDLLQVQLSISNLQQSAAEVQSGIDVSNYNMVVMLGLPDTTQIEIVEAGLLSDKPAFDLSGGMKNALVKRPEVKAADNRLTTSHRMLKIARGYYSPVISGGFNYYYNNPNQRIFFESHSEFDHSWDIGVKLSWNITNLFTTQFQTKEAKLNIQQAEAQHDMLTDNIKMEVNANYSAYKLALDKIELNKQSIEQATENQRLTKDQYTNGIKNITDMLNADNQVIVSEINLLNAKIDAEIAYAKLLKATAN
jgi:outer membrane protein TolC